MLGAPGNTILSLIMIDKKVSGSTDNFATSAVEYQTKYRSVVIVTGWREPIARAISLNVLNDLFISRKKLFLIRRSFISDIVSYNFSLLTGLAIEILTLGLLKNMLYFPIPNNSLCLPASKFCVNSLCEMLLRLHRPPKRSRQ